jgi:serine/threonine protein kinase/WD40 repeat protein
MESQVVDEAHRPRSRPPEKVFAPFEPSGANSSQQPTLRGPSETGELLAEEKALAAQLPDRFQVVKVLGRGSFGVVFQARDARLSRDVALKVLRPEWNAHPTVKARFLQESRAAARLNHASIVRVLEADEFDGIAWQVCDVIDGTSLSRLIAKGSLELHTAVRLIADLADAIDNAHRSGIVHRDIKPDNILVHLGEQEDLVDATVHLTDFGLAKILDDQGYETREGFVVGTPKYLAPELMESNLRCDYKLADIYSLGVVLFECLTGKNPFFASNNMFQRARQETKRVISIRDIDICFPKDLDAVCKKAMAFYPDQRYLTAGKFAEDLRAWLRGSPTEARPLSSTEILWRFAKDSPVLVGLFSTVLLCLIGIAIVQLRANSAFQEQQSELEQANRQLRFNADEANGLKLRYENLAWQAGLREAHQAWGGGNYVTARQRLDQLKSVFPDKQNYPQWQLLNLEMNSQVELLYRGISSVEEVRFVPATRDVVAITERGELLRLSPDGELEKLYDTQGAYGLFSLAAHPTEAKIYFGGAPQELPNYDRSDVKQLDLLTGLIHVLPPQFYTTLESIELNGDGSQILAGARYEFPILISGDDVIARTVPGNRPNRWMGRLNLNGEYFVYQQSETSIAVVKLSDSVELIQTTEVLFDKNSFSNSILFAGTIANSPFMAVVFSDIRAIAIVDCRSWKVVQMLRREATTNVASFASTANGGLLAVGLDNGEVIVWDLRNQPWWYAAMTDEGVSTDLQSSMTEFADTILIKETPSVAMMQESLEPIANLAMSTTPIQSLTFSGSMLYVGTKGGELLRIRMDSLVSEVNSESGENSDGLSRAERLTAVWAKGSGDLFVELEERAWLRISREAIEKQLVELGSELQTGVSSDDSGEVQSARGVQDIDIEKLIGDAIPLRNEATHQDWASVRVSANGKVMAWLENEYEVRMWREGQPTLSQNMPNRERLMSIIGVSPQGDMLLLRGEHHLYYFLDLTGTEPKVTEIQLSAIASHVDWHPNEKKFVVGGDMQMVIEYDYEAETMLKQPLAAPDVNDITYFDNYRKVVTAHGDGILRFTDLANGEVELLTVHRDNISSIAIDPTEQFGLSVDRFGDLKIWSFNPVDIFGSLRNGSRTARRASFRGPSLWVSRNKKQVAATLLESDGMTLRFWNY